MKFNGISSNSRPVKRELDDNRWDWGEALESKFLKGRLTSVIAWTSNRAGHSPPSKTVKMDNVLVGPQNKDIEFAEVA